MVPLVVVAIKGPGLLSMDALLATQTARGVRQWHA
jgi:hypothetical protein